MRSAQCRPTAYNAYAKQVEADLDRISTFLAAEKEGRRRTNAIGALSLLVGALLMAPRERQRAV